MRITLSTHRAEDYELFLKIKRLPRYRFEGRTAVVPDEYAGMLGHSVKSEWSGPAYIPIPGLFDYQRDISRLAIRKRKFAVFADPGLGKTLIELEFARYSQAYLGTARRVLIVCPLMVVRQTIAEAKRFYTDRDIPLKLVQVKASELRHWITTTGDEIGITNYEGLNEDIPQGTLGALLADESSIMKSAYGKWGNELVRLGKGLDWKLCLTGTPAPNDSVEFGLHAVHLDAFLTTNSFLSRFFVNRGQTDNRWELKAHAVRTFYKELSHWCIFLSNPATYSWVDNCGTIPPIHVHIHDIALTEAQQDLVCGQTGTLFANEIGGITSRSVLSQIANGNHKGSSVDSFKPKFIKDLVDSWRDRESTIIWCKFNIEHQQLAKMMPEAASISGDTPYERRVQLIEEFQSRKRDTLITKSALLGFGMNLQVATRMIFSGIDDSYEKYWQCVKRANRVGSTEALHVHIPVTDADRPMLENTLRKARNVERDTRIVEELFRGSGIKF